MYSEKATKFCEISTVLLTGTTQNKSKVEIQQNFVAFSEYMNFNTEFICKLSFFLVSFLFSRQKKYKDKSRQITSDWSQVIQILFLLLSNFNFPAKNDCNWRKTQKLISKLEVYISLYLLLLSFQFSAKKKTRQITYVQVTDKNTAVFLVMDIIRKLEVYFFFFPS